MKNDIIVLYFQHPKSRFYEYSYHLEVFVFLKIDIAILMNFIIKGDASDANNLQFKNIIINLFVVYTIAGMSCFNPG